jgi:hypothetical protein
MVYNYEHHQEISVRNIPDTMIITMYPTKGPFITQFAFVFRIQDKMGELS